MDLKEHAHRTVTLAKALLYGKTVGFDRMRKRVEICSDCEFVERQGALLRCGVCSCKLQSRGLVNLARFEETDDYGCKHEEGSQWKAAGV